MYVTGIFKGITYRLNTPQSNALRMALLNEVNATRGKSLAEHVGKLDNHNLGTGYTPQVYRVDGALVTVRCHSSNFNNQIWLMEKENR